MKKDYEAFLVRNNLSNTAQRESLYNLILDLSGHFCEEDIWQQAKDGGNETVSLSTLYRFLKLLVEDGSLIEHHFHGQTVYEVTKTHHDHIICEECGAIEEFHSEEIETIQDNIAKAKGFTLTRHRHELYGTCSECSE